MKNYIALAAFVTSLAGAPLASHAQDDDIMKKIVNSPPVQSLYVIGSQQSNKIIKDVTVQAGSALEVQVLSAGGNPWDVAVQSNIHKGDVLIAVAWLKTVKTENGAPGQAILRLQLSTDPYTGLEQQSFTVTNEWAQYQLKTVAADNFPKDSTNLGAQLALQKQTIDIGPIFVLDLGPDKPQS